VKRKREEAALRDVLKTLLRRAMKFGVEVERARQVAPEPKLGIRQVWLPIPAPPVPKKRGI
jgi:hypothetical protein